MELTIEMDEEGLWHHRLPALNIWTYELERNESLRGLQSFLDTNYDTFCLVAEESLTPSGRDYRVLLEQTIASVR